MRKPKLTEEERKERVREQNRKQYEKFKADPERYRAEIEARKARRRERRAADPEYAEKVKIQSKEANARHKAKNPTSARESAKRHRDRNREKVLARRREIYAIQSESPEFKEKRRAKDKRLREQNREKVLAREKRRYEKNKQDPAFVLLKSVRGRVFMLRKTGNFLDIKPSERTRFLDYFGGEPRVVISHFEALFRDGMTWENRGKVWQIDHIIPISAAKTPEVASKLNHYKNLQPLLKFENQSKGDKMPDLFPEGVPFTPEEVGFPISQAELKDPAALSVC